LDFVVKMNEFNIQFRQKYNFQIFTFG